MAGNQYGRPVPINNGGPEFCNAGNCGAIVVGSILIVFGMASIGVGIAIATAYSDIWIISDSYIYSPIWAGVLYLIAGGLGTSTCCCFGSQDGTRCTLIAFMVMCIFALLAAGVQVIGETLWATWNVWARQNILCDPFINDCTFANDLDVRAAHISAAVIGGLAGLTALIGSIMGCVGLCSGSTTGGNQTTIVVQGGPAPVQGGYPGGYGPPQLQGGYGPPQPQGGYSGPPPQYIQPYGYAGGPQQANYGYM
ncbi:uncharacterized protein [Amphiura filiformis]|uniref:uncharacterized protein n=1 Tax=Amphiura filiformis TaxID=82378 RepID=UPI003B227816